MFKPIFLIKVINGIGICIYVCTLILCIPSGCILLEPGAVLLGDIEATTLDLQHERAQHRLPAGQGQQAQTREYIH